MTAKGSSTQVVLDALRDLHQQEQIVTRETLQAFTGLKLPIIDDRIRALVEEGLAIRVQRGVFVPAEVHPPARPMTKTLLPDGTVNLEIGDTVLILTPVEDRMLARIQAGVMMQAATIEVGHQTALLNGEIQGRLNRVERTIAKAADGALQGVTLDGVVTLKRVAWFTRYGMAIGNSAGEISLPNRQTYAPDIACSGAAGVLENNGIPMVVTTMRGEAKPNNLATGDFADLEIGDAL